MFITNQDILRLLAALLVGGLIGAERERHRKAVGLRTLILISVGSALFTMLSMRIAEIRATDPARIASNIVVGVGFLGAGVILEDKGRITGLTTAATIWFSAALGMACGLGEFGLAGFTTLVALLVLLLFTRIERSLAISEEVRTYEITCLISWDKYKSLKALFKEYGLEVYKYKQEKKGRNMVVTFDVGGATKKHDKVVQKLLADPEIKECWF